MASQNTMWLHECTPFTPTALQRY